MLAVPPGCDRLLVEVSGVTLEVLAKRRIPDDPFEQLGVVAVARRQDLRSVSADEQKRHVLGLHRVGHGIGILPAETQIENGRIRPSKMLVDSLGTAIARLPAPDSDTAFSSDATSRLKVAASTSANTGVPPACRIAFAVDGGGGSDIWAMRLDGSDSARPYLATPFFETRTAPVNTSANAAINSRRRVGRVRIIECRAIAKR